MKYIFYSVAAFLFSLPSLAGTPGFLTSAGVMALTSSTEQGGEGPQGSTILSQTDLVYNFSWYGFGAFFQYDKQGESETDLLAGPKIELHGGPFYLEAGYAVLTNRSFTDRSISEQTGSAILLGLGVRFKLGGSSGGGGSGGGWFFQGSYKLRMMTIKDQDGVDLDEPIKQNDGYPLAGFGYLF